MKHELPTQAELDLRIYISPKELAIMLGVSSRTASRLMDRFAARGCPLRNTHRCKRVHKSTFMRMYEQGVQQRHPKRSDEMYKDSDNA